MHQITAPLRPGDQGAEVANLQSGLRLLLVEQVIPADPDVRVELLRDLIRESAEQVFEGATEKTVWMYQESLRFEADGVVDDRTAAALNEALRGLGLLGGGPAAARPERTVAGQVLRPDRTAFAGRVILYAQDGNGTVRLGEEATDPEGRYAITFPVAGEQVRLTVRVVAFDSDGQSRAEASADTVRPVEVIDLLVRGDGAAYRVTGRISTGARAGLGGLQLEVVDRNVGGDIPVAQAVAGPDGTFRVAFTYAGGKDRPDLRVYALSDGARIGASEVRYDALHDEVLDVAVPDDAQVALATEHAALTADLATHFTGNLRDLRENVARRDVTFLANKTGWDARAVAMASLADEFSARTTTVDGNPAIPPALFYTLFRAGLPATDDALYRVDAGRVATIWQQGIDQGIVPAGLAAGVPDAIEEFRTLSARQTLSGPALAGQSSLAGLLTVSLPDATADQQQRFARLRIDHQGDPAGFWSAVTGELGDTAADRLKLDGKLAYLTLNNAPLIERLHTDDADPLTDPAGLIDRGFHRAGRWLPLIEEVPPEVPGGDAPARQANYADLLAAQLRLSYPTATVAAMVAGGETAVAPAAVDRVHTFLRAHHDTFDIGLQPVEQYLARAQLALDPDVRAEVARIQRVRQITPGDDAMNALLARNIDSAYAVARYDRAEFVAGFAGELGGAAQAELIHARAQQVHAAVLNLTTSYLLAGNAPGIGVHSPAQIVNPAPVVPDNVGDVIAYPTLEKLLGDMDYCDCEECRSVLSPAAYLVDLLQFVDRDEVRWAQFRARWAIDHGGAPYPYSSTAAWDEAGQPGDTPATPLEVLLSRRPDLQHLPLTCENTNTPVPYIDLVNETLEYFVANKLSLDGFQGYDTDDGATPAEVLANPQFVQDAAYDILAGKGTPAPLLPPAPGLPFHLPLERLRRLFAAFGTPLPAVMAALIADDAGYDWTDVRIEQLGLSRAEYTMLTDQSVTLPRLAGLPATTSDDDAVAALSPAQEFSRRLGISYDDVVELLRTRFVNPHGALIGRLERLGVPLSTLQALKNGTITDQAFDDAIAPQVDPARYGGDIKAWVRDQANYDRIMGLLVLADPTGSAGAAGFAALEFRYADPARLGQRVRPIEFVRLLRFVRLWKTLGWTVAQTDKAITALYPADPGPGDDLTRLDAGFQVLVPRLGVLARVLERPGLSVRKDLLPLLSCFAPLDTYGAGSLYRTLFLAPTSPARDAAFAEDGYGNVLDGSAKLLGHTETLRAALSLSGDELAEIARTLGFDADTPLTVATVSAVYRRGWLARTLGLSVVELLRLIEHTGIDPFAAVDPAEPALIALIDLVDRLRSAGLKPARALALIWDRHLGGAPDPPAAGQIDEFMRVLRAGFATVDADFAVTDDPDGQLARARMALVYDTTATDFFFGLLGDVPVAGEPSVAAFFARYPELRPLLDAYLASADPPPVRRTALLAAFLPDLGRRRKRQQATQLIGAAAQADGAFAATILDTAGVLPAVDDLVAVERPGLSVRYYFGPTVGAEPDRTGDTEAVLDYRPAGPNRLPEAAGGPLSAVWSGYLEAPAGELFQLRVTADADATVRLVIGGVAVEPLHDGTTWTTPAPIPLTAGRLYAFDLTVENVRETVSVRWQCTGRGWEVIPARYLYSATLRERLATAYLRFFKVAALAAALRLSAAEVAHLGAGWLGALPVAGPSTEGALAGGLAKLLGFAELKAALSPDDERLLSVLRAPRADPLIALTRWDPGSLDALLTRFGTTVEGLTDLAAFRRVHTAFTQLTALGTAAGPLIAATTNDPAAGTVRDLQGALRARYAAADWLAIVKPINDELRGRQRDALVAYVLHQLRANPASAHLDTPDKLFEFFLMDVQMEPVMQTSRIRNALAACQLFIDRCLMNLEPRVAASAINGAQWEWMKRYRVWEANRKVFLWPENWLEPELRDDQSPFFEELMSELLQGDVTEDRAATAMGKYLAKLDMVAKLEPAGIHYAENDPGTADDVAYVVARTAGANRAYFWRRREFGYWTPWEQIKLDIEDNPVLPVLWKSRLFLFWIKILQEPDLAGAKPFAVPPDTDLIKLKTGSIQTEVPQIAIRAMLCWSEFYNGVWQPAATSDPLRPTDLGVVAPGTLDRSALRLSSSVADGALRIDIDGQGSSFFVLYNSHSLPVRREEAGASPRFRSGPQRYLGVANGTLTAGYARRPSIDTGFPDPTFMRREVLRNPLGAEITEPRQDLTDRWSAPFFYGDSRHVFWVSTTQEPVTVKHWQSYGGLTPEPPTAGLKIPDLVLPPKYVPPDRLGPVISGLNNGLSDPDPILTFVTEDAYITKGLGTIGTVRFGSAEIGPAGSLRDEIG
jgi:hypothetical protein